MELILIKEVADLGYAGDEVKVKNGYARNYLLPQRLAVRKSPTSLKRLEKQKADFENLQKDQKEKYETLKAKLSEITELGFGVNASKEGKIYGSITADTIAKKLLEKHDIEIDKRKIIVRRPIKLVSEYEIEIVLDKQIKTSLKLAVKAIES